MKCTNCGSDLSRKDIYCADCGKKVERSGIKKDDVSVKVDEIVSKVGEITSKVKEASSKVGGSSDGEFVKKAFNKANRPFSLSENEIEVKTYNCISLRKPNTEGFITITNKRVMYYAFGDNSKMFSEVYINKVSGVSSYYGKGKSIKMIILSIILAISGIITFPALESVVFLGILLIVATIIFLLSSRVIYTFRIFSEGADKSPISIGVMGDGTGITGQGAGFSMNAYPTYETDVMMKEIGAIILDFKNLGDHAIKKWLKEDVNNESKNNLSKTEENIFS